MLFSAFYRQLFLSSNPSNIEYCLSHLHPLVSDSMNASLLVDLSVDEIKEVVFQMNGLGAPCLDDFPAYFLEKISI